MHHTEFHVRLAAYAVITRGEEVLLTWFNGLHGGTPCWSLPGGGIEFDESVTDGLVREVLEETGYHVEVGGLLAESHRIWPVGPERDKPLRSQRLVFEASITGGTLGTLEVGGTTAFARWVRRDSLEGEPTGDVVRIALGLLAG